MDRARTRRKLRRLCTAVIVAALAGGAVPLYADLLVADRAAPADGRAPALSKLGVRLRGLLERSLESY